MNDNCISIVLPAFNSEQYIEDTLASIREQTWQNWELIICDDGSTDGTCRIIEVHKQADERIRLIRNSASRGVAEARNLCLRQAKGDYICFIDSDDLWPPDKLAYQLDCMLKHGYDITCGHFMDMDEQGRRFGMVRRCHRQITLSGLLKNNCVLFQTVMAKAVCLPLLQFKNIRHEDFVLAIDLIRSGVQIHGLDRVLAYRRRRSGSLSANKWRSAQWRIRIYRDYLHLNWFRTVWYTGCYACLSLAFQIASFRRQP